MMFPTRDKRQKGFLLLGVLIFSAIAITTVTAFVTWGVTSSRLARRVLNREQALAIAEAGIEYARWYLAHYQNDFQLGTGEAGPYEYEYEDKNGEIIGSYTLTVTPPSTGSTVVTVRSTGTVAEAPVADRTIQVKLAIPSLAKYSVLGNSDLRFGEGTVIYGPVHSNGGIRFDGVIYNLITSAKASYDDPDHDDSGPEKLEFGVHTHVRPPPSSGSYTSYVSAEMPPAAVPVRTDVFKAGRQFPVPAADFAGITNDLATIKAQAQASGRYFAASGALGYQIVLKNNDTFDLYRVNAMVAAPSGCSSDGTTGWGTWSVKLTGSGARTFLANYAFPANGLIFAEDDLWVEGTINTARLTIGAARFPDNVATRKSITINNDLRYTNYDGQDVVALIAQHNINVGMVSEDDLRIDAAIVAQNGRAGRYYYESDCSPYHQRDALTLYGMIASSQRYGFAYTNGTGYDDRIITYDTNLLYAPPPNFPLASDKYQIISWEELE